MCGRLAAPRLLNIMSGSSKIEHRGTVVAVDGDNLKVEIISVSACGSCSAANLCSAAEKKSKVVDVIASAGQKFNVGDVVDFVGDDSMGVRAVVIAYVVPLMLVVVGLVCGKALGLGDAGCAVCAIAPLAPFYLGLYFLRGRVDKQFKFRAKNL